jgi:hypothetical protein
MDHIASLPPDPVTGLPVWLTHGQIPIYNNGNMYPRPPDVSIPPTHPPNPTHAHSG